jgi:hypothetical protein
MAHRRLAAKVEEEVDLNVRHRRENETYIGQRIDGLHNTIERFLSWNAEAERLENADDPLRRSALATGVAVETTLRDRRTMERELLEWVDRVAQRDTAAESDLFAISDEIADVDRTVLHAMNPDQVGRTMKAAVDIMHEYGARQMKLARSFERREISGTDMEHRVVADAKRARDAVEREVEKAKRSTGATDQAAHGLMFGRLGHGSRTEAAAPAVPQSMHSDEAPELDAALMQSELRAAKAARASAEALIRQLEDTLVQKNAIIARLEEENNEAHLKAARMRRLVTDVQEGQLFSKYRTTVAIQCNSTVLRAERAAQTDLSAPSTATVSIGRKPSFGKLRSSSSLALPQVVGGSTMDTSPRALTLADAESEDYGSPRLGPSASVTSFTWRENAADAAESLRGQYRALPVVKGKMQWTTETVQRLLQCHLRDRRRLRVQNAMLKFSLKLALRSARTATADANAASSPGGAASGGSVDRLAVAKLEIRRLKDTIEQHELRLKFRDKELTKSIEKQYSLTMENGALRKRSDSTRLESSVRSTSNSTMDAELEKVRQLPTQCLDVIGVCIQSWRATRTLITKRIQTQVKAAPYESEQAARVAAIAEDIKLLGEMDGYFLGCARTLEEILHPVAVTLAADVEKIGDSRGTEMEALRVMQQHVSKRAQASDASSPKAAASKDRPTRAKQPTVSRIQPPPGASTSARARPTHTLAGSTRLSSSRRSTDNADASSLHSARGSPRPGDSKHLKPSSGPTPHSSFSTRRSPANTDTADCDGHTPSPSPSSPGNASLRSSQRSPTQHDVAAFDTLYDDDDSVASATALLQYVTMQPALALHGTRATVKGAESAVVQVVSRATQCGPSTFGFLEVASSHVKKLKRRLRQAQMDATATAIRQALPMETAAPNSATRDASPDRTLLREQVDTVYRSVVERAKLRVIQRASVAVRRLSLTAPPPTTTTTEAARSSKAMRHLAAMMARHKATLQRLEDERVGVLLRRAAQLEHMVYFHGTVGSANNTGPAAPASPVIVTGLSPRKRTDAGHVQTEEAFGQSFEPPVLRLAPSPAAGSPRAPLRPNSARSRPGSARVRPAQPQRTPVAIQSSRSVDAKDLFIGDSPRAAGGVRPSSGATRVTAGCHGHPPAVGTPRHGAVAEQATMHESTMLTQQGVILPEPQVQGAAIRTLGRHALFLVPAHRSAVGV